MEFKELQFLWNEVTEKTGQRIIKGGKLYLSPKEKES
jgi:hypothetical protein